MADIIEKIKQSLHILFNNEQDLIENTVHENAINGRLAHYLHEKFEEDIITVDIEYNRHIDQLKNYGFHGSSAVVDIVIHQRMSDENNIAAFECKKGKLVQKDLDKINALIGHEFNYQFGITVEYNKRIITIYQMIDEKIISEILEL